MYRFFFKRLYCLLLLLICGLMSAGRLHAQTILYVDSSIVSSGNGSSWSLSFKTLQEALTAAETATPQVQIWVKKGTYYPTAYPKNCTDYKSGKDKTFLLAGGTAIYGGFAGTETSLQQRNSRNNPTIFSGDIGVAGDTTDNCRHIVMTINNSDTVTLDGITFTKADAHDNSLPGYITVDGNHVPTTCGGGIYNWYTPLKVNDCHFQYNSGDSNVCIYNVTSFINLTRSDFLYNTATIIGPAIGNYDAFGLIEQCLFRYNSGSGCVYNNNSTNFNIINCFITNNTGDSCVGMFNYRSSVALVSCVFAYNRAVYGGGGMGNIIGGPLLLSCTFAYNSANGYGGDIYSQNAYPTVSNSIFWGSTAPQGAIYNDAGSESYLDHCLVQGGHAGMGNKDQDPLFIDPADPDGADNKWGTTDDGLQLQCNSPALNTGDNNSPSVNWPTDIAGNDRVVNTTIDMGAYESPFTGAAPAVTISASPGKAFCAGTNITFTAQPSNVGATPTFEWRANNVPVNSTASTYSTSSLADGDKVSVIVTSSESACITSPTATDNIQVTVYAAPAAPVITAIGATSFCEDSSVLLTVAEAKAYLWSNNAATQQVKATTSGVYHVRIQNEDGCWSPDSKDTTVTAVPFPVFSITSDNGTSIVRGAATRLTATATTGTIAWTPVAGLDQPASFTTIARPDSTTTYTATVSSLPGCATSHSITIQVMAPETGGITANKILTPNGDGINDYLVIEHIENYPNNLMQVFDRAGKLVYQQRNYHNEWNGIKNGRPFVTDTYFYVFTVNGQVAKKSSITIVK